jgi:hypothetical protein
MIAGVLCRTECLDGYVPNLTWLLTFVNVSHFSRPDENHQVWLCAVFADSRHSIYTLNIVTLGVLCGQMCF